MANLRPEPTSRFAAQFMLIGSFVEISAMRALGDKLRHHLAASINSGNSSNTEMFEVPERGSRIHELKVGGDRFHYANAVKMTPIWMNLRSPTPP